MENKLHEAICDVGALKKTPETRQKQVERFVYGKIKVLDRDEPYSRAACAKLRCAIGKPPGATPDIWEMTLQGAPEDPYSVNAIHTALTLYALHHQGKLESMSDETTGFGTAIAKLIGMDQNDENVIRPIRRRFNAAATSLEFTELAHHAKGLIQLLKSKDIKMNYPRFAGDLYLYQFPDSADGVRLKWGQQFYRSHDEKDTDKEGTDEK